MKTAMFAALAAVILFPAAAKAEGAYFIELGNGKAQEDVTKQWDTLSASHKRLLGGLKLYPKTVYQDGAVIARRIQAGPIAGKDKAEKICRRLFKDNVPCFVLEGLNDAPPSTVVSITDEARSKASQQAALPWLSPPPPVAAPPQEEAKGLLPWLLNDHKEEETAQSQEQPKPLEIAEEKPAEPAQEKSAKGDVEVAQAVRVPLSEDNGETVAPAPEVKIADLADSNNTLSPSAGAEPAPAPAADNHPGWLSVASFADEDNATFFWQHVKELSPGRTAGLHVRIIEPAVTQRRSVMATTLSVGPFASQSDAMSFCHDAIETAGSNLTCRFGVKEPSRHSLSEAAVLNHEHADAYAARRQASAPAHEEKLYWVQVVSAASQIEALHAWSEVKDKNADVLKGMRGSVTPSLADSGGYAVRVGPIRSNDDATSLCGTLHDRGVDCHVLGYSSM
ncbi:MAG: SPOR domain-containing protein [Pseudomonadota bacterium]|nr:SPOR domain-containing protein [Pseudomonadota bacterium]